MQDISSEYYRKINDLELEMRKDLKKDNLIFFFVEGEIVGIGSEDRKMKLIQDREFDMLERKYRK